MEPILLVEVSEAQKFYIHTCTKAIVMIGIEAQAC